MQWKTCALSKDIVQGSQISRALKRHIILKARVKSKENLPFIDFIMPNFVKIILIPANIG